MPNNAEAAQSLFDAWEKRDFNAIAQLMAEDVAFTDSPSQQVVKGPDAVRDWYASWASACPDATAGGKVIAASEDTAVAEGIYTGTNTGPFGPLPSTGRTVTLPWTNVFRFRSDGKIIRGAAYYDQMTVLTQLGHMQAPA